MSLRYIDLFAGLGGFHLAMKRMGHECVFASEIDPELRDLYSRNHGIYPHGDITDPVEVDILEIPEFDVLCAGFPCQPFSKAGKQLGLNCPERGSMFWYIMRIIKEHLPPYVILENVANLANHAEKSTIEAMVASLREEGYEVQYKKLSPHHFGIPQHRERIFIVASRYGLTDYKWPITTGRIPDLYSVINDSETDFRKLPDHYVRCLDVWQEFLENYPRDVKLPSFPIWSMEFGATYPFENETPSELLKSPEGLKLLGRFKGSFGIPLEGMTKEEIVGNLPSHSLRDGRFPEWKRSFIRQNRELYGSLRPWIDEWKVEIAQYASSLQKMEWNYKGGERDMWKHILQFRASGIRVKKSDTAPSLVSMTTTQLPVVGRSKDTKRYMSRKECASLQSMTELKYLPKTDSAVFRALGNAVNVDVVEMVINELLPEGGVNSIHNYHESSHLV